VCSCVCVFMCGVMCVCVCVCVHVWGHVWGHVCVCVCFRGTPAGRWCVKRPVLGFWSVSRRSASAVLARSGPERTLASVSSFSGSQRTGGSSRTGEASDRSPSMTSITSTYYTHAVHKPE